MSGRWWVLVGALYAFAGVCFAIAWRFDRDAERAALLEESRR